jgi:hypothetical protein
MFHEDNNPALLSVQVTRSLIERWLGRLCRAGVASAALLGAVEGLLATASPGTAQTLTPSVRTAISDPMLEAERAAVLGIPGGVVPASAKASLGDQAATAGPVVVAATDASPVAAANAEEPLAIGPSSEGTILSITPGEDRIIETVPGGEPVSMNAQGYSPMPSLDGYGWMPSGQGGLGAGGYVPGAQYGLGGGAYSGYASYGSPGSNPCCPENCHDYYVGYEAMFFKRVADKSFSLSPRLYMDDFDFEFGGRYTIGQMLDCTDGVEFVFTGPFEWNRSGVRQAVTTPLESILTASSGYIPSQIDTFNNGQVHYEEEVIELTSYEANRRWFAWDIASTLIGFRAFTYNENFLFSSVTPSPDNGVGALRSRLENFLIGGQIGSDIMRPVGQRLSLGTQARIGLYANCNKGEMSVVNRDSVLINASRRSTDFAAQMQFGGMARYRITRCISTMAGYEAWVLAGVATSSDQNYTPVTPNSGTSYNADDIVFFHGATGGLEIKW